MKQLLPIIFLAMLIFSQIGCVKEEPIIPNEEEIITTLIYTLTSTAGGSTVVFSFSDLDGDGGDAPLINSQKLSANTTYDGVLEMLNETSFPAESITEEVEEEADEHQLFYLTELSGIEIKYKDLDGNGKPVGLRTTLTTGSAGSGKLRVVLRHEPNKSAAGVEAGSITNAGGETDIEVSFDLNVE